MARRLMGFTTREGEEYFKKEDAHGRTYYVRKGEGRVSQQTYSGAQSRLEYVLTGEDDELPPEVQQADGISELSDVVGIDFSVERLIPISAIDDDWSDTEIARRAEANRFIAFADRNMHLSKEEAAREYLKFRNEVSQADDAEVRALIRRSYNLGGS